MRVSLLLGLCYLVFATAITHTTIKVCCPTRNLTYSEEWNYFNVRPNAYLFYWLYYENISDNNRPLILWLQGGPGVSGTGFGNFQEIGPLDVQLSLRSNTWLSRGDLLFVDSPVGTGFSYVTKDQAYAYGVEEIAQDLVHFTIAFMRDHPNYQNHSLYIVSESYGGKVAAVYAWYLYQEIEAGNISMDFHGVGLGNSWISPIDFVLTWPDYLFYLSRISTEDVEKANSKAQECDRLVQNESWLPAADCWREMKDFTLLVSGNVSFYNVLKQSHQDPWSKAGDSSNDELEDLMNGEIRKKLGIIPDFVQWQQSSSTVFSGQRIDFMAPVIDYVDKLLNNTNLTIFIYNGQLDVTCNTAGVERWVNKLNWTYLPKFQDLKREPIFNQFENLDVLSFLKKYGDFYFFYILNSGHIVPADAPMASLAMLDVVLGS